MNKKLTASLLVEVYAVDLPDKVFLVVTAAGPVKLTSAEVAKVLRTAANMSENHETER